VTQPLSGIRVADFSRVLAGPLCTQMLADLGADVVKIEEPERGDETRRWGPPFVNGVSGYFLSINRNKRSIALDLKRGGDVARSLIERADVVVDNFLPSQRASLGLADVRAIHPRAVHCTISGYDSDTPDAAVPGYDLLAQAGAGLMSITGEADGDPMKAGVALSDVLTAHYAFGAINAALVARERTGNGASIEISLFSATLASLVNVAQSALLTRREAKRFGNAHPSIVPYQVFHAKDRAFAVGAGTDRHFAALCDVVERPQLAADARFATNAARVKHRANLVPLLERIFATKSAGTWVSRCRKKNIPASLVQGVREALSTTAAQPLVATLKHPIAGAYEALRNPLRIDGERLPAATPPPLLGQHTDDVLRELGYSSRDIAKMRAAGVIGPRTTSGTRGRRRAG
jgi:crotonobetainyl-CoA:carnitine CoA-transferase CaiB-like acyl-CoA transferase